MPQWISKRPLQVALRTYALALSLSLGPSLIPFAVATLTAKSSPRTGSRALQKLLRANLGLNGFAFAMMLSVAGGTAISELWSSLDSDPDTQKHDGHPLRLTLSPARKTFIAYVLSTSLGAFLLQPGRKSMPQKLDVLNAPVITNPPNRKSDTLDLTLLLFVRAADSVLQTLLSRLWTPVDQKQAPSIPVENCAAKAFTVPAVPPEKEAKAWSLRVDAFVFWACSARIMWCWFYKSERLPRSYVKWIANLANLDRRMARGLQLLRSGQWSYLRDSSPHRDMLQELSQELGYNPAWGDPHLLPAYGGALANEIWKSLGVTNRSSIGGLPCEIVHGGIGSSLGLDASCTANASLRGFRAFLQALAIYLPVHFLPTLLTRPKSFFKPQIALANMLGAFRSAAFLSSFVALYWYSVCITRTLVFARMFPFISHDFWDGAFGGIFAGSLICGSSIWIENGYRRGEMALYVLPRALRSCLPDCFLMNNRKTRILEKVTFILSFATLLSAAVHNQSSLRGLSRWALWFVMNGSSGGPKKSHTITTSSSNPPDSDYGKEPEETNAF